MYCYDTISTFSVVSTTAFDPLFQFFSNCVNSGPDRSELIADNAANVKDSKHDSNRQFIHAWMLSQDFEVVRYATLYDSAISEFKKLKPMRLIGGQSSNNYTHMSPFHWFRRLAEIYCGVLSFYCPTGNVVTWTTTNSLKPKLKATFDNKQLSAVHLSERLLLYKYPMRIPSYDLAISVLIEHRLFLYNTV